MTTTTEIQVTFIDSDLKEVFADSPRVVAWVAENVLHLELRALRRQPPVTPGQEVATEHVVSRIAMPLSTAGATLATLQHHLTQMEQQGVIKRMEAPVSGTPKH